MLAVSVQVSELLINKGAEVNEKDNESTTPLMLAGDAGNKAVVELLLAHGADASLKDKEERTAGDRCKKQDVKAILIEVGIWERFSGRGVHGGSERSLASDCGLDGFLERTGGRPPSASQGSSSSPSPSAQRAQGGPAEGEGRCGRGQASLMLWSQAP